MKTAFPLVAFLAILAGATHAADAALDLDLQPKTKLQLAREQGLQANLMWFDAAANLERLSSREGVRKILDKCVDAGINGVAVGVKSPDGFVLYNSKIAPRVTSSNGKSAYPKDYDLLQTVIEEGHARRLRVYAMLMVFSEGRLSDRSGPAYTKFPEWQSWVYDIGPNGKPAVFPSSQSKSGVFLFVNPLLPDVQRYELSLIEEIAANYDIDGLVIDRCRYDGLRADFSQDSRAAFERYIGRQVSRWPEDVYELRPAAGATPDPNLPAPNGWMVVPGPQFRKWVEWRVQITSNFVFNASQVLQKIKPGAAFGSVVGAWYPEYVPEGVNWASRSHVPKEQHWWATQRYRDAGYAEYLDFLVPNCYGSLLTVAEGRKSKTPAWWTIEGGARTAVEVVNDVCHVYGGLYVEAFKGKPGSFRRALGICLRETDGVKIFDLSHVEELGWWGIIKEVLERPAGMPHEKIKSRRSSRDDTYDQGHH